jgi:hypothetical protein
VKRCYKCKNNKKDLEFYKDKNNKSGLTSACKSCMIKYKKEYQVTKKGFLTKALNSAKHRAKKKNVLFALDFEHIESIATKKCPIFNVDMLYYACFNGSGNPEKTTASLDRIIPELGYVQGNVVFISHWANTIKSNATEKELYAVADWLHEARKIVFNAQENSTPPVPTGHHSQGEIYPKLGSFSATGVREDSDNPDYHSGTDARQDADYCTEASSGDSLGRGDQKVGSFVTSYDIQNYGEPSAKIVWIADRRGHIPDKP